jgi:hypothetical protein
MRAVGYVNRLAEARDGRIDNIKGLIILDSPLKGFPSMNEGGIAEQARRCQGFANALNDGILALFPPFLSEAAAIANTACGLLTGDSLCVKIVKDLFPVDKNPTGIVGMFQNSVYYGRMGNDTTEAVYREFEPRGAYARDYLGMKCVEREEHIDNWAAILESVPAEYRSRVGQSLAASATPRYSVRTSREWVYDNATIPARIPTAVVYGENNDLLMVVPEPGRAAIRNGLSAMGFLFTVSTAAHAGAAASLAVTAIGSYVSLNIPAGIAFTVLSAMETAQACNAGTAADIMNHFPARFGSRIFGEEGNDTFIARSSQRRTQAELGGRPIFNSVYNYAIRDAVHGNNPDIGITHHPDLWGIKVDRNRDGTVDETEKEEYSFSNREFGPGGKLYLWIQANEYDGWSVRDTVGNQGGEHAKDMVKPRF